MKDSLGISEQYCWQAGKGCNAERNYRQHKIAVFVFVFMMIRCIAS